MTRPVHPPVDYLRECSSTSLRYFEISKLEHVANLRRELTVLLEEMMEESALALFARWMLEGRSIPLPVTRNSGLARAQDSRRARNLLADFIKAASPGAGERASFGGAERPALRGRAGDSSDAESSSAGGMPGRKAESGAREHGPPHRGETRAERRTDRRKIRRARGGRRLSDQTT